MVDVWGLKPLWCVVILGNLGEHWVCGIFMEACCLGEATLCHTVMVRKWGMMIEQVNQFVGNSK